MSQKGFLLHYFHSYCRPYRTTHSPAEIERNSPSLFFFSSLFFTFFSSVLFSSHHWDTVHSSWRNLKQPNKWRENKLLMQYSCTWDICTGKCWQFPLGVSNYNVCFIKNDNRVHRACILVINCNVLLISCCYLYLRLYAADYTVHLHHSESNRRDMRGMFTWCNGAWRRYAWTSGDPICVLAQHRAVRC